MIADVHKVVRWAKWTLVLSIAGAAGAASALALTAGIQGVDFTATHGVRFAGQVALVSTASAVSTSSVTWGDGQTSPGTVTHPAANGTDLDHDVLLGDHVYSAAGRYTVTSEMRYSDNLPRTGTGIATVLAYPPSNLTSPGVTGNGLVGGTLTCTHGTWNGAEPISYGYAWLRDGQPISGAGGSTYSPVVADGGYSVACRVRAANSDGSASADTFGISVPAVMTPNGPGARAALGSERLTPTAFRAAPTGPSAIAGATFGARVTFSLNRSASVRFTVTHPASGRRVGRRCVKPTRANRRARSCTRSVLLTGAFTRSGSAGSNHFRFTGRLGGHKLRSGSYRLVATPSAGGRRGRSRSAGFRIIS